MFMHAQKLDLVESLSSSCDSQSGQASLLMIMMLGIFLLASVAFAVDLSNLWFLRQAAQTAADAACEAGAMDLLLKANGGTPPSMGFVPGTAGQCSSGSGNTICTYAAYNGFTPSSGGMSNTAASTGVVYSFPTVIAGVQGPSGVTYPFLKVVVEQNVRTWFMSLLGKRFQVVAAACTCGLTQAPSPAPIVILYPGPNPPNGVAGKGSLYMSGGVKITIIGGPQTSLEVNSTSSRAVNCDGSPSLDTSKAGPSGAGGDIAVVGPQPTSPNPCVNGGPFHFSSGNGQWKSPVSATVDPYASVGSPTLSSLPNPPVNGVTGRWVTYGTDGCPDHNNAYLGNSGAPNYTNIYGNCLEFSPGYYPNGINLPAIGSPANVMNNTALFLPGIYYMDGNLVAANSTTLRSAFIGTQPSTQGAMFYFHSGYPKISGCSGCTSGNIDPVPSYYLNCSGTSAAASVPASLNGNVLVGYCVSNGSYYGSGSSDTLSSSGIRGILMYSDHSNVVSWTQGQEMFAASGQLNFAGALYFSNNAGGNYGSVTSFSGAGGGTTYVTGQIVTDQLMIVQGATINMVLNGSSVGGPLQVGIFQ